MLFRSTNIPLSPILSARTTQISPSPVIKLTWTYDTDPDVTGFRIYRSTDQSNWSNINIPNNDPTLRTYDDNANALASDQIYYYYIQALGTPNNSDPSNTASTSTYADSFVASCTDGTDCVPTTTSSGVIVEMDTPEGDINYIRPATVTAQPPQEPSDIGYLEFRITGVTSKIGRAHV